MTQNAKQFTMPQLFGFFSHSSSTTSTTTTTTTETIDSSSAEIISGPQAPRTDKRKRKSVSFFDRVVVFEYIGRNELSEAEVCQCWYDRTELHHIHQENDEIVRRMMAGACSGNQWCPRGLESRTATGARLRSKHRREAVGAVLEYQLLETESGIDRNDEKIAKLYCAQTEHCARIAQLMATIDAQAVVAEEEGNKLKTPHLRSPCTPNRCSMRRLSSNHETPSPIVVRAA